MRGNIQRYILCCLIGWLMVFALPAQTNKQIRRLQKQQSSLKKDIENQENMLVSTRKDVRSQLANLQVITAQIEGKQNYVDSVFKEVSLLNKEITALEHQLKLKEKDLQICKRNYQRAVTYVFQNRMQISKWMFIFSAKDFREMYRRMRYITEFSKYQLAQGKEIQRKEEQLRAHRKELLGAKNFKNRLIDEGKAQTRKLESSKAQREKMVDELNKKQKQLQRSISSQKRKYQQLNDRIDKLIQEEIAAAERRRKAAEAARRRKAEADRQARLRAERQKAAEARKGSKRKPSSKSNSKSEKGNRDYVVEPEFNAADPDRALSGSFAANRGRLPMPITGSYAITTHFGQYNVPGLKGVRLDSKGINVTGRPGARARAIFKGEVTAIFAYGGLYNIIVRHGSYMSVYCNLSSTSVRRGQQVSACQELGTVAKDESGNSTLHFQLRKETSKLNPESWLGR